MSDRLMTIYEWVMRYFFTKGEKVPLKSILSFNKH